MSEILKCNECGSYTMSDKHCGLNTISSKPAKWSPLDKYGDYRLKARMEELKMIGLA